MMVASTPGRRRLPYDRPVDRVPPAEPGSRRRRIRIPQGDRDRIGAELRRARVAKGISQRILAHLIGVSPGAVSAAENGRVGMGPYHLTRAADVLDLDLDLDAPSADGDTHGREPSGARRRPVDWRTHEPLPMDAPLEGALAAFLEVGYHGATVRDIAARAGLSVPGLYHHYPTKQDLLVRLLRLTMDDLLARCRAARAEGDTTVQRFAFLVECLALFHIHRRSLGQIAYSEMRSLDTGARERYVVDRRQVQQMLLDEVDRGVAEKVFHPPDSHVAARAIVAMCMALPQWYSDAGASTTTMIARQHVDVAFDVVRCPVDERP